MLRVGDVDAGLDLGMLVVVGLDVGAVPEVGAVRVVRAAGIERIARATHGVVHAGVLGDLLGAGLDQLAVALVAVMRGEGEGLVGLDEGADRLVAAGLLLAHQHVGDGGHLLVDVAGRALAISDGGQRAGVVIDGRRLVARRGADRGRQRRRGAHQGAVVDVEAIGAGAERPGNAAGRHGNLLDTTPQAAGSASPAPDADGEDGR